jgi:hypothetical protein
VRPAVALTATGAAWLAVLHQLVALERSPLLPLVVRDVGFALPAVLAGANGAVALSERLLRGIPEPDDRLRRGLRAVLTAAAAAAAVATTRLAADGMAGLPTDAGPLGLVRDAVLALGVLLPVALVLMGSSANRARSPKAPLPRPARPARAGLAMAVVSAVVAAGGAVAVAGGGAVVAGSVVVGGAWMMTGAGTVCGACWMMMGVGCGSGVWTMTGACAKGVGCVAAEVRALTLTSVEESSREFVRKRKMMDVAAMARSATVASTPVE